MFLLSLPFFVCAWVDVYVCVCVCVGGGEVVCVLCLGFFLGGGMWVGVIGVCACVGVVLV